jgi:hypothetical protein
MQATTSRLFATAGLTVALGLAACGSSAEDPAPTTTTSNTSTGITTGTTTSTDTDTGTTVAGAANGSFLVYLKPENVASGTKALTTVSGMVFNGPKTAQPILAKSTTEGACSLYVTANPFCSTSCGDGICVAKDTCEPDVERQSVGTVTVSGVQNDKGTSSFEFKAVNNAYSVPESLLNPPAAEGAAVTLTATGDVYPAFSITGKMVAPLVVTNPKILLESGKPFTLTWTPAGVPGISTINVELDLSHHGGTKGRLICESDDTGSLLIPAAVLKELIDLGVAGFPSVKVTRSNVTSAVVGTGKVDLKIYADVSLVAEMPNLISCNDDSQCPTGQTCQNPGLYCK